jgi:nitrate reductase cytochrome c-type subunit
MNSNFLNVLLLSILTSASFFGCQNEASRSQKTLSEEELSEYQQKGGEFVEATQKVLASNLVGAIQEKGTEGALEFCNIQAIPLTDSMAVELQAHISRVTDQPRNPDNLANKSELEYIRSAKSDLREGNEVTPAIHNANGKVIGYYPIITNQLCMQCHGNENSQINQATLDKLKTLYPDDQATGYDVGELRGIWVVEMEKHSE